jgi:adenosylhomocysteine nucleosidase
MSKRGVTLFVAAEAREFEGLMRKVGTSERLSWPVLFARKVEYGGNVAVLVAHGPGPKLAAEAARVAAGREPVGALVSTGFCGALDPSLAANDIFVARDLIGVGPALAPHSELSHRCGSLVSGDRVAVTAAEKAELRKTGGDAVEMEAAGVAEAARELSLPFYCVRVITDTAEESLPLDFNKMRDAEGRFSRTQIVCAALRNPKNIFPKLIKLNGRCQSASRTLGEFLANCRF